MTDALRQAAPVDPSDLDSVRRALDADGRGATRRRIGLRRILIEGNALDELPGIVEAVRRPGDVVVVMDATPMWRGDADLKADVLRRLSSIGATVRPAVLGADRPELHADERAVREAGVAIEGAGCVVSVGSGTVTDVAKDASHRASDIPLVVVQTAVSVNAFSDDMAVLLRSGVKRTVPSRWPDALLIDLGAIAGAPAEMNRAGFGELTAMFTAPADWYLATAIGHDTSFDRVVVSLVRAGGDDLVRAADGVRGSEPEALAEIARQMTMTGIAMGVAGRTAPLSGTEHTISHLLDMTAERDGRRLGFHGAQVGVAAVVVALAWRRVLRDLDPERLRTATAPDPALAERRVRAAFDRLDETGAAAAECWRDYRTKLTMWPERRAAVAGFATDWERHAAEIEALVEAPERIVDALRRAGAATRFSELDPPVGADTARWAIASCHLMRDRYTVADLVDLDGALGRSWGDSFADELLAEAAAIGAGL